MTRPFNFSAGPAMLPDSILARARDDITNWNGRGGSIMETPFTGKDFLQILERATDDLRALLDLPEEYRILFMQGGATAQFALVPLNLLGNRGQADYVETGYWAMRAADEARRYCKVRIAASGAADSFRHIPPQSEWTLDPRSAYCHITTNETADGIAFHWTPDTKNLPLVADMTSDFLTRPVDVRRFGLIYAAAQKNLGAAGLAIVIVREDLVAQPHPLTPSVFSYRIQLAQGSRFNTPPIWAVYIAGLMFQWIQDNGGLSAMEQASRRKSAKLYALLDSCEFYCCRPAPADRSLVNISFALADGALENTFLEDARAAGLENLKGHGRVGGLRASLYNAMPDAGVDALVAFMMDFARSHG